MLILLAVALVIAALVAGCGGGSGTTTTATRTGALLFAQYCAGCHGNDGRSNLTPTVVGVDAATVKAAMEKGTPSAPAFTDRLSPDDIDAVVTFVGTLN